MARVAYVYALLDPKGRPRYVGSTTDPRRRVAEHWSRKRDDRAGGNPLLSAWLRSLDAPPEPYLLEVVDHADRYKREAFHTERLWSRGCRLLNIKSGAGWLPPARLAATMANRRTV